MTIPELFDSLKTYIRSVIQDKITVIETKTVDASNSASAAEASAGEAAQSASDAASSASEAGSAATTAVTAAVNDLKGGAPAAFDTLGEIADELAASQSLHSSLLNQIADAAETAQWSQVSGTPSTFPPEAHKHTSDQISDASSAGAASAVVKTASNGRFAVGEPLSGSHPASKGYVDGLVASKEPKSWTGTQAEYDALGSYDPNTTYNVIAG